MSRISKNLTKILDLINQASLKNANSLRPRQSWSETVGLQKSEHNQIKSIKVRDQAASHHTSPPQHLSHSNWESIKFTLPLQHLANLK